jgi:hypothetical protein
MVSGNELVDGPGAALVIAAGKATGGDDCGEGSCGDGGALMSSGCHSPISAGGSHPNLNAVKEGQY